MIGWIFDNAKGYADFATTSTGTLADVDSMTSLAFSCLFTDAPDPNATDFELPATPSGWYADKFFLARQGGRPRGSRLWTLRRSKLNAETVALAKAYALEAVSWWATVGIARDVEAGTSINDFGQIVITITATKPDGSRWEHLWAKRLEEL